MDTTLNITRLHARATKILKKLVKPTGIYASTDSGWSGAFHSYFGRDSAITTLLIVAAEDLTKQNRYSHRAYDGLRHLKTWQGTANVRETGEQFGKFPHEIQIAKSKNKETLARLKEFKTLWYKDPKDGLLKNWDSIDSTPLWIIGIARWHEQNNVAYSQDLYNHLSAALTWCLHNLEQYNGWAAFSGFDLQPGRKTGGIHNQSWKDSYDAYQNPDGSLATQPIKDVYVNGCFWAALRYGAAIVRPKDDAFADKLEEVAAQLKKRFNHIAHGLLFRDSPHNSYFFAEALDGDDLQLRSVAADVGLCLSAYYKDECIIEDKYIADVVKRLMKPDMFNPEAGIRNYSNQTKSIAYTNGYHRGSETYWPFVSGLMAQGFSHFGYSSDAERIAVAMMRGVSHFRSCIELFQMTPDGTYILWHHPIEEQQSTKDQAWTAAAIYYASIYLA